MSVNAAAKRMMVVRAPAHGFAPTRAIIAAPGRINPGPAVISGSNSETVSLESGLAYNPWNARVFDTREKNASSPQHGVLSNAFVSWTYKKEPATNSTNTSAAGAANLLISSPLFGSRPPHTIFGR